MPRTKAEVERYIAAVHSGSPSLKEKPVKGFLFAKLYYEANEYELAKKHVSAYLTVHERDPKAHKFLGQLYEREQDINKAVGCYKRSVDLNPAQRDLVLKVAELLCSLPERDGRAEFWVEKAAKLHPGSPAIYNLKEKLLSSQGEQGWNQLFDLLQSELQMRPDNAHVNVKLVQLYCDAGRMEEAVDHCFAAEKKGLLRCSMEWYSTVVQTLQEYLAQPSVLSNDKLCPRLKRELLLAQCSVLRLTLSNGGVQRGVEALRRFDIALQSMKKESGCTTEELLETISELRGHLYLHAGTLLLKMALEKVVQWRAVMDLAALCYLIAYQVPKPKTKPFKGEKAAHQLLDLLAYDRKSQSGHMLLNLSWESECFLKDVVEKLGNPVGQGTLVEELFGPQLTTSPYFISSDDIRSVGTQAPELDDLAKWDSGAIMLHGGDLQHLVWLSLQWQLLGNRPAFKDWLKKLFPRLPLETKKLDTNAPESICLLDLEVFLCGVAFTSQAQLQEASSIADISRQQEPRCLPLQVIKLLSTEKQRAWWDAVYSLIHKKAVPGTSAKLRMIVQHSLGTLRGGEKHGLQPALVVHWAQHLSEMSDGLSTYFEKKDYISRSAHYWNVALPLLEKIKKSRNIPEPLDPLFMHFRSKELEILTVGALEEEAKITFATLEDIEGNTEEAIAILETLDSVSSNWHLAQIFQRLSEEASSGLEETEDRCITFRQKLRKHLTKVYRANAADIEKLPVSMEEIIDLLNEVNQLLGDRGESLEEANDGQPVAFRSDSHIKFSTPSPVKGVLSPSKKPMFSPRTPPYWAEDQKSVLQMLCQKIEALKDEVHHLRHNSSGSLAAAHHSVYGEGYVPEARQEPFPPAQSFHGAPLTVATTGPSVYYNQSPTYNSQYLPRTTANVTPTKASVYGISHLPPPQHIYTYQQPVQTPPLQTTPAVMYPQEQVYGAPLRFDPPAANMLSPYTEDYYTHPVPQPSTAPHLPEPGYFTKPSAVSVQPPKSGEGKPVDFGKINLGHQSPVDHPKVPSFGTGVLAQSTPAAGFKFNSNFKSNDGDFTFSSAQTKNSETLLGLLTSDIPVRTEALLEEKSLAQDKMPSQGGIFNFGDKSSSGFMLSTISQSEHKPNLTSSNEQPFTFSNISKPVFHTVDAASADKGVESDDSTRVEEDEDGPHFEPIVPLPDKVDVRTGEEEEEEIFCNRAKLFRFEGETKEWKERGIGSIKILRHKMSGKVRLLMRRDQVLKICANHYITADMELRPNAGSDKSWVWHAIDYADEMPKSEQLAIRFKTADEAALFKTNFDQAKKEVSKSLQKEDQQKERVASPKSTVFQTVNRKDIAFGAQFAKKDGEWDCSMCCIRNPPTAVLCLACQNASPNATTKSESKLVEPKGFVAPAPAMGGFTFQFGKDVQKTPSSASSSQAFTSFGQIPMPFKFGTDGTPKPSGFGAQFAKKPGQWDCTVCEVRNEATATHCAACQNPNPSCKPSTSAVDKAKSANSSSNGSFGAQFAKKPGQWDCTVCEVRNEATATHCAACHNPNPSCKPSTSAVDKAKSANNSSNGSFGAQFAKKPGQWDCIVCEVRNEATATHCAACHNPNPSCKPSTSAVDKAKSANSSSNGSFGAQFAKKPGQWDCTVCEVRNEATATHCAACHNPNPSCKPSTSAVDKAKSANSSSNGSFGAQFAKKEGQWDCDTCLVRNDASAVQCVSCQSPCKIQMPSPSELEAKFGKKDGQWDCDSCLVRNESTSSHCDSCQTPKPNIKGKDKAMPASSVFTFGLNAKSTSKQPPSMTPSSMFKFGQNDEKSSSAPFKFEAPSSQSSSSSSFSFSIPVPAGGFKFGIPTPVKDDDPVKSQKPEEKEEEPKADTGTITSPVIHRDKSGPSEAPGFLSKPNMFSFADLAKSSGEFQFGQKDPDFKGFSRAGEQIFALSQPSEKGNASGELDEEDLYKTEENDDIQFEPVVQMPERVDLVTGEENEEVLYCQRVKLFRFDADTSQWKERGVGNLKFLKNKENGRLRVLMRREQVLKVCANHWITTTMNLKPLSGSDKAWMWLASDFSDGEAKLEQLAAKFKTLELAEEFKQKFEECQRLLLDIPLQTPHKLVDTGRTARLIQKAEEMKSGLKDLKLFLTDDKTKMVENESQVSSTTVGASNMTSNSCAESTVPTLEWDNYDLQKPSLYNTSETSLFASPSASKPVQRNLFRFGESTSGFSFSFQPVLSPSKSPSKLNHSRVSVGTDEELETTQEEERDGQYFEPVVPLPDLVEISTGEENEQVVFCHRAKLYRYDKDTNQWKERGIGDVKILQNYDTKRVRLVMRRDQVLKLCANHWVTSSMKLEPMKGAEKAWVWSAFDFAEGEGRVEQLAIRFKAQEAANSFKDTFDEAKNAQNDKILLTPVSSKETLPYETLAEKSVTVTLKETPKEIPEMSLQGSCTPDNTTLSSPAHSSSPSKPVFSSPKFVFGSGLVQKIFETPESSTENISSRTSQKDNTSIVSSFKASISKSGSQTSTVTSTMPVFRVPERASEAASSVTKEEGASVEEAREHSDMEDVEVTFEKKPTLHQAELAQKLKLPLTFFCYQNEPGYCSDSEEDDEDFQSAVRKLNGKLYQDPPQRGAAAYQVVTVSHESVETTAVARRKVQTPEEERKADASQHPLTTSEGMDGATDFKKGQTKECLTEVQKVQESLKDDETSTVSSSSDISVTGDAAAASTVVLVMEPDSSSETPPVFGLQDSHPIDLSAKKSSEADSTTQDTFSFGFQATDGFSFADLAKNAGDFAFGNKDSDFTWANAGAAVFSTATVPQNEGVEKGSDDDDDDDDEATNVDVHFEPIVSLPEVETKSGEEDEEILFKERTKLYRWDRDLSQWKERGVGDIKILYHPLKKYYRVLMRREQVLKVCANHTITKAMELKPMNTSTNALVWTATDYSEGEAKIEQLAAKFKTLEVANTFKRKFEECQNLISQTSSSQVSCIQELSRESNPVVYFIITADDKPLGKVTMELFCNIVPKTAENFRALCTGEQGFGFSGSLFHRIIPDFICQGGDITNQDGTGGKSIYGDKFEDENFDVRHTGPGILSMVNRGQNTNTSQFFITLKKTEHLDFKHVAFGFVKDGMDVVKQMGALGSDSGKPTKRIVVAECGQSSVFPSG